MSYLTENNFNLVIKFLLFTLSLYLFYTALFCFVWFFFFATCTSYRQLHGVFLTLLFLMNTLSNISNLNIIQNLSSLRERDKILIPLHYKNMHLCKCVLEIQKKTSYVFWNTVKIHLRWRKSWVYCNSCSKALPRGEGDRSTHQWWRS